jgi:hypothetical protein
LPNARLQAIPFEEAFELLFKFPAYNKPMMCLNNDWVIETLTQTDKSSLSVEMLENYSIRAFAKHC